MSLKRVLGNPLSEEEAKSLTKDEKAWLRSWNRHSEIPGEEAPEGDEALEVEGDGYDDMSNEELRTLLKARDLPTSGNKDELVGRLEEDDESSDDE